MEPIYLRALERDDLERTHKWHNDRTMYRIMGGTFHYVSRAAEEAWLRKKEAYSPTEVMLAICVTETSQHIGNIYLRNIDWAARHAEGQIWIGEVGQRTKGYGRAAAELLISHAFEDLGLHRLYVLALEGNPSIHMAETQGFVREGVLRDHVYVAGKFKDLVVLGMTVDDYRRARPRAERGQ